MSTSGLTERMTETSPRPRATIAGVFYLLTSLAEGISSFVGGGIAATANSILVHQSLFRLGSPPTSSWWRAMSL